MPVIRVCGQCGAKNRVGAEHLAGVVGHEQMEAWLKSARTEFVGGRAG